MWRPHWGQESKSRQNQREKISILLEKALLRKVRSKKENFLLSCHSGARLPGDRPALIFPNSPSGRFPGGEGNVGGCPLSHTLGILRAARVRILAPDTGGQCRAASGGAPRASPAARGFAGRPAPGPSREVTFRPAPKLGAPRARGQSSDRPGGKRVVLGNSAFVRPGDFIF